MTATFQAQVGLIDLVRALSKAIDLISPRLRNHHFQVAYIAGRLGRDLGLDEAGLRNVLIAALVHDVGGLSFRDVRERLSFDDDGGDITTHARVGGELLSSLDLFTEVAPIVTFHHEPWADGRGCEHNGQAVPALSHLLHLADRIQVLIDPMAPVLGQVPAIIERIRRKSGPVFRPDYVDLFLALAGREEFWLTLFDDTLFDHLHDNVGPFGRSLDSRRLLDVARFFGRVIDTRSRFTAMHSAGVAAVAETLARETGFSGNECFALQVAGHLHDLGKLAVPQEILEKPGKLDVDEWALMRTHSYHSHRVLSAVPGLETVAMWTALHHERLNGEGYPYHSSGDAVPLPARILAVADVYTALKENRPYRTALTEAAAVAVLKDEVARGRLDRHVVDLLCRTLETIDRARLEAQGQLAEISR